MAGGIGAVGHVGFAPESSGGVPAAATMYIEALSENLVMTQERFEYINIAGRISEPDDMVGVRRVAGQIVTAAHPVALGHFLRGAVANPVVTAVETGSLWRHSFKPPTQTAWDDRFALQPWTFEIFRDVGSSQQYAGCNMAKLALSAAPNQDLRITADIIGVSETNIAKTSPSYVTSPAEPFAFDTCSISLGGAATAKVEAFNWTMDNALEGIPTLSGRREISKIRRNNFVQPRFQMTVGFEDISEYLDFRDQTERAIVLNFFRASSFGFALDMPRCVYTAFPMGMQGRGRQTIQIDGKCRHHTGSATSFEARLTTVRSNFL